MSTAAPSLASRLRQVLAHFGLTRVHIAGRLSADWQGLVTEDPEAIASLALVCPTGIETPALQPIASRLLLLSGDQGAPATALRSALAALPGATLVTLPDYFGHPRADMLVDRGEEIGTALQTFLAQQQQQHTVAPLRLPSSEGDIAGISYRLAGAGSPLLLLPLGLAASQWEPLLPALSAQYCTIVLGGAFLGSVVSLETRGQETGYLGVVRNILEEASLRPGETVLDVGCGSGVLDRWLARRTGGANPITAVDIHRALLREAAALARQDGLEGCITFREGNAEALPFPENSFDVTMSATVMELLDADRMVRELLRVTKPGGRVVVVVRAVDMSSYVSLPLAPALKAKVEALPNGVAGAQGCADGSLYRRLRAAGLRDVKMCPQLATYAGAHAHAFHERVLAALTPEETAAWHAAVAEGEAAGTPFFVALPFHAAVGTKEA